MAAKKKPLAPLATRVKTDPKLLARVLANPGLRGQLPDRYLNPAQLQSRKQNQYLADVGDIGTPLSGQSLINTAQQAVKSEFDPLLANVGNQEQIVNKSAGLQGNWAKRYYGDLNGLLGAIGGQQATANTNALQGVADRGAATQGAIAGADQAAQQRLAQDALVRGGGLQGSAPADLAARTAQQQGLAASEAARAQQSTQAFGDAQSAFLRGLQGASAQQGGEYQQQITGAQQAALGQLAQGRTDLQSKQAGSFTDTLLKLRQNEAQNAITAAGLNIRTDSASASATNAAGAEGRKYGYTPEEWAAMPAATRTGIVAAANKKPAKTPTGYGPGGPGMNKYGYTYDEWKGLGSSEQAKARAGKGKKAGGTGTGGNRATNTAIGAAQDGTTTAQSDARASGIPIDKEHRHQLANLLLNGRPETSATVNQKTKDGSVSRKVVQTPAIDKHDALYTSVALDVLIDGHVSRYNANRLHARGLKVEDLGFPTYSDHKKKSPAKAKLSPSERAPGGT